MKNLLAVVCALLSAGFLNAQQKEGRVVYERTAQFQIQLQGMGEAMQKSMPHSRTDKMEVLFGNNQSLKRALADDTPEEDNGGEGGGVGFRINMIAGGADDVIWYNFDEQRSVNQTEFATKKYLVSDSVHKLNWKLTGETKTILGYACQQAVGQRIGKRMMTNFINGQMSRTEIGDTSNIVVWFTSAIPVSAGPEYQGQLPGLILGIDINDGRTVYKATEVSPKVDVAVIKEPKSGKKVSQDEFNKERAKMMEEMQKNSGGGGNRKFVQISQ
jgi:GLPGLI family protein